jgi:multiple sugar transport system substrate-binding protein
MTEAKKLNRRDFLRMSVVAATGALAAACAPPTPEVVEVTRVVEKTVEKPVEVTRVVEKTVEVPAEPSKVPEMEFWNGIGPPEGVLMQDFMNRFEDSRPDMKVTQWTTDWEAFYTKIRTTYAEGIGPDLAVTHPRYLTQYADTVFQPIDDLVKADPDIEPSMFAENAWKAASYNGKQYGLPLDVHMFALYINVRLLEEAGVDFPQTEDDLIQAAKALSKPPDQWGLSSGYNGLWAFIGYMAHRGQKGLLNEDNTKAAFNNEAGIGALQRMYDNIYKDKISWSPEEGLDPFVTFMSQTCAMRIGGTWEKFAWDTIPGLYYTSTMFMPEQPGTWGSNHILVFPRMGTDEETQAAWDAAKFILKDCSVEWGKKAGHVPALLEAAASEDYLGVREMQGFRDSVPYIIDVPKVPKHAEISGVMWGNIGAALANAMGVEEALADAEEKVNALLAG